MIRVVLLVSLCFSPVLGRLIHRPVIVGDPVILPAMENCMERATWDHQLDDGTQPVAVFDLIVFRAIGKYENRATRLTTGGNMSVNLARTIYNDKQGSFVFRCGGRFINEILVDTLVPSEKYVSVGHNVTLEFYFDTSAGPAEVLRWEKDGELVCEVDLKSGTVTYGPGFEGSVSITRDLYREGNLSLTLMDIQPADQGLYRFYHGKDKGEPAAVKMTVRPAPDKPSDQPTTVAPAENTKEAIGKVPAVTIAVVVTVLCAGLLCVALGWWLKSRRSNVSNSGTSSDLPAIQMPDLNGCAEKDPLNA